MTRPDIEAIQARADAAPAGPWFVGLRKKDDSADFPFYVMAEDGEGSLAAVFTRATDEALDLKAAEFVASARHDIPDLLNYVRQLENELATLRHWKEQHDKTIAKRKLDALNARQANRRRV